MPRTTCRREGARAPVGVRVPLVAELLLIGLGLGLLLQAPGAWGWTYKEVKAVCGAEGEPKPCRKLAVDGLAADGAPLKPCWWKWQQPPGCKARSKKKLTQLGAVFGQATPPPPAAAPPPADDAVAIFSDFGYTDDDAVTLDDFAAAAVAFKQKHFEDLFARQGRRDALRRTDERQKNKKTRKIY